MDSGPPDVFEHADFRRYLEDWFKARKARSPQFSHRAFARKLGTSDPSVLLNIIHGRRRLSAELLAQFVRVLDLDEEEARYFRLLVQFAQAGDASERERSWAAIAETRSRLQVPEIDSARFLYLSDRVYPTIRALAQCAGFRADPHWIASQLTPPVNVAQATEALALLERLGFLVRDGDALLPADPVVRTDETVPALASGGYHMQNHQLAGVVLEHLWDEDASDEETAFLGLTLAIPQDKLTEVRRMLWEAQLQVLHRCKEWGSERDRVYQLNLQLFPVSARTRSEGS
jgi:uncharacterized protein (TIGR02147 family)